MDSFFDFLDRLRGKSDAVKTQVAFGTAFVVTGVIVVVWVTTVPARFTDNDSMEPEADEAGFLSGIGAQFGETKEQMGALVESVRNLESAASDVEDTHEEAGPSASATRTFGLEGIGTSTEKEEARRAVLIATSTAESAEER